MTGSSKKFRNSKTILFVLSPYSLPYTEAALREILRFETLVPSSVPHRTLYDTKLGGNQRSLKKHLIKPFYFLDYDVPKDTFALASLNALHFDETVWKNPNEFRPERYLDYKGRLSVQKDASLPFGAGRRLCAGETFARNTMFLCIAALCQNFNLRSVESVDHSGSDDTFCGLTRMPEDFWIKFEAR